MVKFILHLKYYFLLFLLFFIFEVNTYAQSIRSIQEKYSMIIKADSFIGDFINNSNLISIETGSYSSDKIKLFKALFASRNKFFDHMIPSFFYNDLDDPNQLKYRDINEYLLKVEEVYPEGYNLTYLNVSTNYYQLNTGKIQFAVARKTSGKAKNGLYIEVYDTTTILASFFPEINEFKVIEMNSLNYSLNYLNDKDKDFVFDQFDKCDLVSGTKEFNGCPPPRGSGLFLNFNSSFGKTVWKMTGTNGDNLFYKSNLTDRSKIGSYNQKNENNTVFSYGLEVDKYFGWKRKFGIGAGVFINKFNSDILLAGQSVYYVEYKSNANNLTNDEYRRILTGKNIIENVSFRTITIPITFLFKSDLGYSGKWQYNFDLGPFISLFQTGIGDGSATFDYEARANYGNNGFEFSKESTNNDIVFTREFGNSLGYNPSQMNTYFYGEEGAKFNVGLDENISDKKSFILNNSIGFIFKSGLNYSLSQRLVISGGFMFSSILLSKQSGTNTYYLTDKVGEYNGLMNGVKQFYQFNYMFLLGFKIPIKL